METNNYLYHVGSIIMFTFLAMVVIYSLPIISIGGGVGMMYLDYLKKVAKKRDMDEIDRKGKELLEEAEKNLSSKERTRWYLERCFEKD